ncbi:MAG: methyltransferase domain-containing protein [Smithellaceae bacterium]|jgi:ubiquinone/menaquinone biosynthesis C-methylase UbiE|nr:methyltransferase domain-containing protein [Syntrophaceae bacterium]
MPKQVNKEHYFSDDYLNKDRFLALREQLIACLETNGKSFLEIGPGPNLLTPLLKQFNKTTTTLDMAYELKPDIVGDLFNIPCAPNTFDVVYAFQVLEHIPFEQLISALSEMNRVSRGTVIFSVPDHAGLQRPEFRFILNFRGREIKYELLKRIYKDITNPREHCWEIGCRGIDINCVIESIAKANLYCCKHYIPCAYFHFFVCKRIQTDKV